MVNNTIYVWPHLGVEEGEPAAELDVSAALDAAPLRPQEDVLEVELHLVDHVRHLGNC